MSGAKQHRSRVQHREPVAKNVYLYPVDKPEDFTFRPGQAVELAVDQPGWSDDKHLFTITSLLDNPHLEFIIKSYPVSQNPKHAGMTEHLGRDIVVGDGVLFGDAWGVIEYQGPGVFIAGGAGITPFIAILRRQEQQGTLSGSRLFISNQKADEVILEGELTRMLGADAVFTLT